MTQSGVLWSCWLQVVAEATGLREERQYFEVGTTFCIVFLTSCYNTSLLPVQRSPEQGDEGSCVGPWEGGVLTRARKPCQCWVLLSTLVALAASIWLIPVSGFPLSCGVPLRSCNYTAVITTLICLSFMPCFVWLNKPFLGHYLIWYGPPQ